jgi:hypothetical protein
LKLSNNSNQINKMRLITFIYWKSKRKFIWDPEINDFETIEKRPICTKYIYSLNCDSFDHQTKGKGLKWNCIYAENKNKIRKKSTKESLNWKYENDY